jgi:hypothetical protein
MHCAILHLRCPLCKSLSDALQQCQGLCHWEILRCGRRLPGVASFECSVSKALQVQATICDKFSLLPVASFAPRLIL